jgi:outer membrane protein OmpA-like peptidoglycan-associated protein
MIKYVMLLTLLLSFSINELPAQLNPYNLRIGAGIGFSNYYGDLSKYRYNQFPDWEIIREVYAYNPNYNQEHTLSVSIEQRINNSWGFLLRGGQYTLAMSDRYIDKNNVLQTSNLNFNRALNFKTRVRDIGLGFVFRTDNGKILMENSLIAPYLTMDAGWLAFKPKGDLLDIEGNVYDYSLGQVSTDGYFETDLAKLQASSNKSYSENTYYLAAGLGLRIRVTRQIEFFIQSDLKRTGTDYIDDVDADFRTSFISEFQEYASFPGIPKTQENTTYRGDPQANKDWLFNHQFGLKISLFPSKSTFRANTISPTSSLNSKNQELQSENRKNEETTSLAESLSDDNGTKSVGSPVQMIDTVTILKIQFDDTLNTTRDAFQDKEVRVKTDSVITWQYPFRKGPDLPNAYNNTGTLDRRIDTRMAKQRNDEPASDYNPNASRGQQPVFSLVYPLPFYSNQSSSVIPEKASDPIIAEVLSEKDSTLNYNDSTQMIITGNGIKAIAGEVPITQKYKLYLPNMAQVIVPQISQIPEKSAKFIENGLYAEIYFGTNESTIAKNEGEKLAPLVETLKQAPNAKILIRGYADNTGSTTYNMNLIEKRTNAVEASLLNQYGVDKQRIEKQPGALLIRGNLRVSRPEDRKVEVQVFY